MRILPGSEIAGIRVSALKQALRDAQIREITTPEIGYQLGLLEPYLSRTLAALAQERVIEHAGQFDGVDTWSLGEVGTRMLATTIQKPMSRDAGRKLVRQIIEAARAINADGSLAYTVTEIVVFGSYLGNAHELGDLDIGVELVNRPNPEGRNLHDEAMARSPGHGNIIGRIMYPRNEVVSRLLVDRRRVSLHELDEVRQLGTRYQQVFRYDLTNQTEQAPATEIFGTVALPDEQDPEPVPVSEIRSNAIQCPQDPPYDPEHAPRKPRRLDQSQRAGSVAGEREIAVQHLWAQGWDAAAIIDHFGLQRQSPRTLRDLIARLYAWSDSPDTSPLSPACTEIDSESYYDPELDGYRRPNGMPYKFRFRVRRVPGTRATQTTPRPRKIDSLETVLAAVWDPSFGNARLTIKINTSPFPDDLRSIAVTVYEDDAVSRLAEAKPDLVSGTLTWIAAVNQVWADRTREIYKAISAWAAKLTRALDGLGYNVCWQIDSDTLTLTPPVPPKSLDTTPIRTAFATLAERYPKIAAASVPDHTTIFVYSRT
mgnify:CR=1 FL=1